MAAEATKNAYFVAKYSKKKELKPDDTHYGNGETKIEIEYGYGVPFVCWSKTFVAADFDCTDFEFLKDKLVKSKDKAKVYLHDAEDDEYPDKYPLLIDINNGEFGFLLPRTHDKAQYDFIQYDNIKYPETKLYAIPVGYDKKTSVHMDYMTGRGLYGGDTMHMEIEKGDIYWSKQYKSSDIGDRDVESIYDQMSIDQKRLIQHRKLKAFAHDTYPETYPLLIDLPRKFTFLLPRYGDMRDFEFLYDEGKMPPDFDESPEEKNDIDAPFIRKYDNKIEAELLSRSMSIQSTNGVLSLELDYKTKTTRYKKTFSSSDFKGKNVRDIYNKFNEENGVKIKIYVHDENPNKYPLLIDVCGEFEFLFPRQGDKRNYDGKNDDEKAEIVEVDVFDYDFHIELVKELDEKQKTKKMDIGEYKDKKYDGIVSYMGMLKGMSLSGVLLVYSEDDKFLKTKSNPFKRYIEGWNDYDDKTKESVYGEVTLKTMTVRELGDGDKFGVYWNKLNNLEKKVFLLRYYLLIGPDLMRINAKQGLNIRTMDDEEIAKQNGMLRNDGCIVQ